ncbi:hypothetical protein [Roseovarius sp. 2305UL8-3]|uniref:hypothetical protein n=1 Tax=Roseovarius conchicola TaxID=3121636 RepID=UPI00352710CD
MIFVILALLVAFVLIVLFARSDMRSCRWRKVGPKDEDGKTLYKCAACGARVLTTTGKAPLVCKVNPRD